MCSYINTYTHRHTPCLRSFILIYFQRKFIEQNFHFDSNFYSDNGPINNKKQALVLVQISPVQQALIWTFDGVFFYVNMCHSASLG